MKFGKSIVFLNGQVRYMKSIIGMLKRGMFKSAFGDVLDVFGRGGDGELSHF